MPDPDTEAIKRRVEDEPKFGADGYLSGTHGQRAFFNQTYISPDEVRALLAALDAAETERDRLREIAEAASHSWNDWDSIAQLMDIQGWHAAAGQVRKLAALVADHREAS